MAEDQSIVNNTTPWNTISSPDIVCFLVPRSSAARQCVAHLATEPRSVSKHVLKRPHYDDEADGQPPAHAIALRLSSRLRDPLKGFKFGRHPDRCDISFVGTKSLDRDPMVSLEHFRIFLDEATGAPVLQDHSAYGTLMDGEHLIPVGDGGPLSASAEERSGRKTLKEGSVIELKLSPLRSVLSFSVRFPLHRTEEETEFYESNLRAYHKRLVALAAEKKKFETAVLSKRVLSTSRQHQEFWALLSNS
ncbi:Protein kinase [Apiospora sp. TS-2023a]